MNWYNKYTHRIKGTRRANTYIQTSTVGASPAVFSAKKNTYIQTH